MAKNKRGKLGFMSLEIIIGKVIKGESRGKDLGFPTANIKLHKKIKQGIYISLVKINKNLYQSLTFIGNAKTFKETEIKAEVFIFSFNKDIYKQWISVKLLKKIRDNLQFKSEKELVSQMENDKEIALEYFKKNV